MISVEAFLRSREPLPEDPSDDAKQADNVGVYDGVKAKDEVNVPADVNGSAGADRADHAVSRAGHGAMPRTGRIGTSAGGGRRRPRVARRSGGSFGGRSFRGAFSASRASADDGCKREDSQDVDSCREAALTLLDAAARPSGALRDRLAAKGFEPDTIDEVISRLTAVQLIDDRAYAESAVRSCLERMYGRRGTVMALTRKGVDRVLAEEVVREAALSGAFEASAWELGRSVARKTSGLDPQIRKRRLWSAGGHKGHSPSVLRDIAHELFDAQGSDDRR